MVKQKEIALVDCNNFFVGCEQMINPQLEGKTVCVVGGHNGCVLARSNEAKKAGVIMGMPYFMAKKDFPTVTYVQSNMKLYHEISTRVRKMLENYSPSVEVYSIDEAFLDLTGVNKIFNLSYEELIKKIRDDIKEEIGINVSVGLANSKTLAKLATEKAKKQDFIYRIKKIDIEKEIKNINIEEIWGIGTRSASTYKSFGIFSALDLIKKDDSFYKKHFGKKGLEIKHELLGESVIAHIDNEEKPKSIQKTSAFPTFSKDSRYIKESLRYHLHNVCSKLRRLNLTAKVVCVMLRTKDFKVYIERKELETSLNTEYSLNPIVDNLFEKIFFEGIEYRASGIFVEKLSDTENNQLELFKSEDNIKSEKISELWDKLETKYGKGIFKVGNLPDRSEVFKLRKLDK